MQLRVGGDLDLDAVIALYRSSTLGERRPVDDRDRMATMLAEADLVVTAWQAEELVGIARCLTDGVWVTYVCDLAVDATHQRRGIGLALLRRVRAETPRAKLHLHAAPSAEPYYPHIGMRRHEQSWWLDPEDAL
jgi:ribosomal protein S18 acetylase RimI-like enzyme